MPATNSRLISITCTSYFATFLILAADPVHAYVGPGAGLTAIGTIVALVAAVVLSIVGFIWYPVRRMLRGKEKSNSRDDENKDDRKEERDDS